jgi:gliding motility associated protien GldN
MRVPLFCFCLIVQLNNLQSQCFSESQVLNPQNPDPCKEERIKRPFAMPYAYFREADVMWSKRMWRVLDLREKLNLPLYYPTEPQVCLLSLFDVLKCALLDGKITAFANPAFDDEFKNPMTIAEVEKTLVSWDSTNQVEDVNNPGTYINVPLKKEITAASIRQYWIKEDWFFDKQRSVFECRIIGLCPLIAKLTETGETIGVTPLFWIYFPQARNILAKAPVFNRWNDAERMSFDELFHKRMFSSYIKKESNVYDRNIGEYKTGIEALLESDFIKENIFNWESDLWHF